MSNFSVHIVQLLCLNCIPYMEFNNLFLILRIYFILIISFKKNLQISFILAFISFIHCPSYHPTSQIINRGFLSAFIELNSNFSNSKFLYPILSIFLSYSFHVSLKNVICKFNLINFFILS